MKPVFLPEFFDELVNPCFVQSSRTRDLVMHRTRRESFQFFEVNVLTIAVELVQRRPPRCGRQRVIRRRREALEDARLGVGPGKDKLETRGSQVTLGFGHARANLGKGLASAGERRRP